MSVGLETQITITKLFDPITRGEALNTLRQRPEELNDPVVKRAFNCAVYHFEPRDIDEAVKLGLMVAPA